MKIKLPTILLLTMFVIVKFANAQLFISSGATFNIQTGGIVTVQGDITSAADITGAGLVILKGSGNQNINMGGFTIPNLQMDNAANATLTGNATIGTDVTFTTGKILQGNFDLTLASTATVSGSGATKYFVTNGTGKLVKNSLGATAFTYPVGNNTSTYNPTTISNSGTSDNIGVRSLSNVLTTGTTGVAFTKEVADASWDITEAVAGGSNLSLTATWNGTDELAGFNRTKGGISYYIPTPGVTQGWDLLNSQTGTAAGADPYTYTRTGITAVGAFAVGTRPVLSPLLVSPKVFLQGAYNTGTGLMNDALRTSNLIPTTEPYTGITNFTQSGSGGAEFSTASIVGSGAAAGNDAIVDWVFAQLHDGVTGAVVGTRSALLQRDGDVVETDGVSPLNMAGFAAGNYFVSIRHRNHLAVRTPSNFALAKTTTTAYNFTDNIIKAYNNPAITGNPAMPTLAAGVLGMYGGNANSDVSVRVSGSAVTSDFQRILTTLGGASILSPVYSPSDVNMDGTVRVTGSVLTSDFQRLLTILSSLSIIQQHL
jgi:hypothetical protein